MKFLSDANEYALRSVVWLAQQPPQRHKLREIADATQSAPGYLIRALQMLTKADILSAQRGSGGGYSLKADPATITVLDVVNAVDPLQRIHECPLGIAEHGTQLCPLHRRIDDCMATIETSFASLTVAEIVDRGVAADQDCLALFATSA